MMIKYFLQVLFIASFLLLLDRFVETMMNKKKTYYTFQCDLSQKDFDLLKNNKVNCIVFFNQSDKETLTFDVHLKEK